MTRAKRPGMGMTLQIQQEQRSRWVQRQMSSEAASGDIPINYAEARSER